MLESRLCRYSFTLAAENVSCLQKYFIFYLSIHCHCTGILALAVLCESLNYWRMYVFAFFCPYHHVLFYVLLKNVSLDFIDLPLWFLR